jgi:hypothetical protein
LLKVLGITAAEYTARFCHRVCPAVRSWRLRARAGTSGGSCSTRSRVRTT